ncbi:MAG: class I SAM-dependent RNA methyltransferase [Bosea sp. (in: a-proteobacteria)]
MGSPPRMQQELTISRLGQKGDGVADMPDGSVFIAFALPGERVLASVSGDRGELIEVLEPAPERIAPFCPLFTRCGGCATQHMGEAQYRAWKRGLVVDTLARAGIDAPVGALIDAHGEGRRRVTFHARKDGRDWLLGFMAARSHDIVQIQNCPVLAPSLISAPSIALALARRIGGDKPLDVQVTASLAGLDVDIRGHGPLNDLGRRQAMINEANVLDLARLSLHGEILVERRAPILTMGRAEVSPPPGGFLQATDAGEAALADLVLAAVPAKAKRIADLFCGCGPFALRLAERTNVSAIDSDKPAIAALTRALRFAQGLKQVSPEARDLFRRPLLRQELDSFDMVVLDPPRAGAEAQIRELAGSSVPLIAYASCNVASFARDAATLIAGGYALEQVIPIDQFRYSAHVEMVGVFRRGKAFGKTAKASTFTARKR